MEIDKLVFKVIWKCKGPGIGFAILKKRKKMLQHLHSRIQNLLKAIAIKFVTVIYDKCDTSI